MERLLAIVVLSGVAIAQTAAVSAQTQQIAVTQSALKAESARGDLPALPPVPKGKSTIVGGEIQKVDPVLDGFTLKVFGQKSMKILFDERTQIFRDGNKISLRDLKSGDRASVQTILDGTNVFALSVHMLSRAPEGECEGRVLSYNPDTRELTVNSAMSRVPIKLLVVADTSVTREGQSSFTSARAGQSDLVKGALISATFASGKNGRAVANQIAILALPGSAFVFSGDLSTLDMHSGLLVLVDPRDEKSYKISFDPALFPTSQDLRQGAHVRVTADFNGTRYVASAISVE
jgi:hypothetical protein